jgi:hypothetical protein
MCRPARAEVAQHLQPLRARDETGERGEGDHQPELQVHVCGPGQVHQQGPLAASEVRGSGQRLEEGRVHAHDFLPHLFGAGGHAGQNEPWQVTPGRERVRAVALRHGQADHVLDKAQVAELQGPGAAREARQGGQQGQGAVAMREGAQSLPEWRRVVKQARTCVCTTGAG